MKIDWKQVAASSGYRSLKAAYIHDVQDAEKYRRKFKQKPMREKAEFLKLFNWVIARATHYAFVSGDEPTKAMIGILEHWENRRDYWWLNFYQDCREPKIHSNVLKPMGIRGTRKYYKNAYGYDPVRRKQRINEFIQRVQTNNSKKTKSRWGTKRKEQHAKVRAYKAAHAK